MKFPDIIIAIDGYSSTGKSSFAKLVASKFGFLYLDSGALYRGVTLFAQRAGLIDPDDRISPQLETSLEGMKLHFDGDGRTCLGEECVEDAIRSMSVSSQVSAVSALPYVRAFVDGILHSLAVNGRVVMDGRDIGTAVFPEAQLKIFMIADDDVRARRRYDELVSKGRTPASEEEVLANLLERDYVDSHRQTHPLLRAEDAYVLDNSRMGFGEEIAWLEGLVRGKFGIYD